MQSNCDTCRQSLLGHQDSNMLQQGRCSHALSVHRETWAEREPSSLRPREPSILHMQGGFVEAWSFTGVKPNASAARTLNPIRVKRDKITCVCAMPTDPYLLLGCASGSLRIASMIALSGSPTTRPASVTGFTLAPYRGECGSTPHTLYAMSPARAGAGVLYGNRVQLHSLISWHWQGEGLRQGVHMRGHIWHTCCKDGHMAQSQWATTTTATTQWLPSGMLGPSRSMPSVRTCLHVSPCHLQWHLLNCKAQARSNA